MKLNQAQIEPDLRIYAIGDVHGCLVQLRELLKLIELDLDAFPIAQHKIVFLGDYVDRGPANKNVIDCLTGLQNSTHDCVFLLGNHDERVTAFLKNPDLVWDDMMKWGGARTLADYGVVPDLGESHFAVSARFSDALPDAHLEFFNALKHSFSVGDYFFCHAGVRPGVPLAKQANHDLIWIRYDFLNHEQPFEKIIVHGHTPMDEPEVKSNRINVDTHCYSTGTLTALVLEGAEHRFLQT